MVTTITSSNTYNNSTQMSNSRKVDRCANGVLWAVWSGLNSTSSVGYPAASYSTDGGTTWSAPTAVAGGGNSVPYVAPSLFIDVDDYAHLVYLDPNSGAVTYLRGTPNAARTTYTWSSPVTPATGTGLLAPDVVAMRDPAGSGGWVAHVVWSNNNAQPVTAAMTITSAGAVTLGTVSTLTTTSQPNGTQVYPSIDFQHTGDGKTATTSPAVYVHWTSVASSARGVFFTSAPYSAGRWTWSANPTTVETTRYMVGNGPWSVGMWDGTRYVIAGCIYDGTNYAAVVVDAVNTTPVVRSTTTIVSNGSATFDAAGNVYFVGRAGSSPYYITEIMWTRSTAAFSAGTNLTTSSSNAEYVSTRRAGRSSLDYLFTDGNSAPFSVIFGRLSLDSPPNAPSLTSPVGNANVDYTQAIPLSWAFSDPDAGDSQSKADVQWRVSGGSTWTSIAGAATTATTYSFPANTWTTSTTIEWQVRTYDSIGAVGPWSTSGFFVATPPTPAPTITAPASGATIGANTYTVTWSEAQQSGYEVRTVADASGSPVVGTVYSDTQNTADTSTRSLSVPFPTNGLTEHVQVRCLYQGLWSPWADVRVTVSFTPPAVPTVVLTPVATSSTGPSDSLQVTVNNPAPGSGQPTVTSYDVLVDDMVNGTGLRRVAAAVPAGQAWTYAWPRSGYDYSGGKVQVTCYAANGTTSTATS